MGFGGKGKGGGARTTLGRGAYYKEKFGGGGRGKGGGRGGSSYDGATAFPPEAIADASEPQGSAPKRMRTAQDLRSDLARIDNKPYGAYRDLEGYEYAMGQFSLLVLKVQADPFAPPSRCCVRVPLDVAGFPAHCIANKVRERAFRDWLTRRFAEAARSAGVDQRTADGGWHGPKGGELLVDLPGQHVLDRSSVVISPAGPGGGPGFLEARFTVALPARGRSVLGEWAATILGTTLVTLVRSSLYFETTPAAALKAHLDGVEDQNAMRGQLESLGLVAFVADGATLPRKSGASDLPMEAAPSAAGGAAAPGPVPFASPASLRVTLQVPNGGSVVGMGVRKGVTLIVGGGFHGKSTLLEALQLGVYDKTAGDGREQVVTDAAALKVRAEDGRAVTGVDISPFIDHLPFGRRTTTFTTPDSSGSTSQAASIIEGLEAGATALLIDEDTSATNFMIRDARMQALVAPEKEPIKPFISRVRGLWTELGVSTILVVGGSGDYFDVADTVLLMDSYVCSDATDRARAVAASIPGGAPRAADAADTYRYARPPRRCPAASGIAAGAKVHAARSSIRLGDLPEIDLSAVEQLVETSQVRAIAEGLQLLAGRAMDGKTTIEELLAQLYAQIGNGGLDALKPGWRLGNLAMPRPLEVAAALCRLRSLEIAASR